MVKGATRTLFCDLQRKAYRFIPNELQELLKIAQKNTIIEVKKHYNNQYDEIIDENLALLEKEEFIFFTDHPEWFPEMSKKWKNHSTISNAIIDINPIRFLDFKNIWEQLGKLGCEHAQLRAFEFLSLIELKNIMGKIDNNRIISVEILMPFSKEIRTKDYLDIVYSFPRIFSLTLHSAPSTETLFFSETEMGHIFLVEDKVSSANHCGLIDSSFFTIHIQSFTESLHHNSCLNRKISIDTDGNIKNCPSMQENFGNIKDTSLTEAIEKPGFKKNWNINKNKIHVCKDCEFRYICTDCRAYVEDPEDILSKPLKCGYNPYTGEWSEWSTNPLKQKAIDFYEMGEMIEKEK